MLKLSLLMTLFNSPSMIHGHAAYALVQAAMIDRVDANRGFIARAADTLRGAERYDPKPLEASAYALGGSGSKTFLDGRDGSVAIINVSGSLWDKALYWKKQRVVDGYDRIEAALIEAEGRSDVTGILIRYDSPGGLAKGVWQCARRIAASTKPVRSYVDGNALSAAYALACAGSMIGAAETAMTGSIGVATLYWDYTGALERWGEKAEPITHGEFKMDGAGFKPFSDGERERLEALSAPIMDIFANWVGERRALGGSVVRGMEAGCYMGIQGVDAGLADQVANYATFLSEFKASLSGPTSRSAFINPDRAAAYTERDMTLAQALAEVMADASLSAAEKAAASKVLKRAHAKLENSNEEDANAEGETDGEEEDANAEGETDGEEEDANAEGETDGEEEDANGDEEESATEASARVLGIVTHAEAVGRSALAAQFAKDGLSVKEAVKRLKLSARTNGRMTELRSGSPDPVGGEAPAPDTSTMSGRVTAAKAKMAGRKTG